MRHADRVDETPGTPLPEPVVVLRTRSAATSSLSWALVPTLVAMLLLGLLDLVVLSIRVVGFGASVFLAPIAGGAEPIPGPDARTHVVGLAVAAAVGLVVAVGASTAWDRLERGSTTGPAAWPRTVRGLAAATIASTLATAVLLAWIDLSPGDLVALLAG